MFSSSPPRRGIPRCPYGAHSFILAPRDLLPSIKYSCLLSTQALGPVFFVCGVVDVPWREIGRVGRRGREAKTSMGRMG